MLWLGERDAERPGWATDLSGHDENGAGFSPSYESWIAKRKPSSRNGSCENPWVLKKGADLEIWELVSLLLAARSGVSPSEDWLSSTLRANITQSSRWRPQSEWVGRRRLAALSVGKATLQRGRGEEQTSLLDSEGKESHHCLSLSFWSYICFTASSQTGQELTATLQSICQLHKRSALWCAFKTRQKTLPVGQSSFPHR